MKYTTCVPLAHDTTHAMMTSLEDALAVSRYVELRLDYLEPDHIIPFMEQARQNHDMSRIILTVRPDSEGGRFAGNESRRHDILEEISGYGPHFTDVEYDTLRNQPGLQERIQSHILVSWHDFGGTPPPLQLQARMQDMTEYSDTVKIVVTIQESREAAGILSMYTERGNTTLVAFAMGMAGRFTRVCAMHLGCPFMYASLGKAVAPGQYSIEEVRRMEGII